LRLGREWTNKTKAPIFRVKASNRVIRKILPCRRIITKKRTIIARKANRISRSRMMNRSKVKKIIIKKTGKRMNANMI
jgi:hypothetical protein